MMKNLNFRIDTKGIMFGVWEIVDVLVTIIKSVLIVGGSIASASADVVLGTLTLTLLFVNTVGTNVTGLNLAPLMVSMGASGIQLILWQLIQNGGGFSKIWKSKNFWLILAFGLVVVMKFGDDFMDITIAIYLMQGSTLASVLGDRLFTFLRNTVLFIVWVLTGFSEIFVVNAIELMKGSNKSHEKKQEPTYQKHDNSQIPSKQGQNYSSNQDRQKFVSPEFLDLLKMSKNDNRKSRGDR